MKKDVSLLILSCDKFHDTWDIVNHSFQKYWPDCPYKKYLLTNYKTPSYDRVEVVSVGEDISWSANLIELLKAIDTEYVFLWLDDAFLSAPVKTDKIGQDFQWAIDTNVDCLKLKTSFFHWFNLSSYKKIPPQTAYRTSIFASLWKVKTLIQLLDETENAWQFETHGSSRSDAFVAFYEVKRTRFKYVHAIEKGYWWPAGIAYAYRENIAIDPYIRGVIPNASLYKHYMLLPKKYLLAFVGSKIKSKILKFAQVFYLKLGWRNNNYYD